MRTPTFQYQSRAESYDDSGGYEYGVALMDWWAPWPDFAPGRRPLVAEGWFAFGGEQGLVADVPEGGSLAVYPNFLSRHPGAGNYLSPSLSVTIDPTDVIPPDVGSPGRGSLQVSRVPARGGVLDLDRMRRHTETVELILNSLLRRGRISRVGSADEFELVAPGFAANRDPGPDDDETAGAIAGMTWVNKLSQKLFFCVDATEGAAVWVAAN